MLSNLFKFPAIMIDGKIEYDKSQEANLYGKEEKVDLEYAIGEVECPYKDFVGISDRWMPNEDSFRSAQEGIFDACAVTFMSMGTFLVPWTRKKFKAQLEKFISTKPAEQQQLTMIRMSTEDIKAIIKEEEEDNEKEDE